MAHGSGLIRQHLLSDHRRNDHPQKKQNQQHNRPGHQNASPPPPAAKHFCGSGRRFGIRYLLWKHGNHNQSDSRGDRERFHDLHGFFTKPPIPPHSQRTCESNPAGSCQRRAGPWSTLNHHTFLPHPIPSVRSMENGLLPLFTEHLFQQPDHRVRRLLAGLQHLLVVEMRSGDSRRPVREAGKGDDGNLQ